MATYINVAQAKEQEIALACSDELARGTAREHQSLGGKMYDERANETADKILQGSSLEGVGLVDMDDGMSR